MGAKPVTTDEIDAVLSRKPAPYDAELLEWLRERRSVQTTIRTITRHLTRYHNRPGDVEKALRALERAGFGRLFVLLPGPSGGRPAIMFALKDEL